MTNEPNFRPTLAEPSPAPTTGTNGKPLYNPDPKSPPISDAVFKARLKQLGYLPGDVELMAEIVGWYPGAQWIEDVAPTHRGAFIRRMERLKQAARAKPVPSNVVGPSPAPEPVTVPERTSDADLAALMAKAPHQTEVPAFVVSPAPRKTRGSPGVVPFVAPNPAAGRK